VLGLLPKVAAVVAAIPPAVLGGAAIVMFGTVAVIGIQTLSRVDFHDDRNVIVVAVSLGLAMIPVAFPTFYSRFGADVQTIVGSGITMGSLSAIVLNLAFNIVGRKPVETVEELPKRSLEEVNALSEADFTETFSHLFQGDHGIATAVAGQRPFASLYELRRAFHDGLFDYESPRALIDSYPDIAAKVALGQESRRDQSFAGLDRLTPLEYERFDELNDAYRAKFGHPFLICVRENTKESILDAFERRLQNTPRQEQMAAVVEIGKIANLRLLDLVEEESVDPKKAVPA
jgi:OHCU decarboxylase